ncbi:hypothetical protein SAMN05444920_13345 [Nonomuraea solani]|uniref:Uncharacterized protein n=1 Tax=Nonomuraea solani TaxID=1144553 RepID=A0A1H6F1A4_9ACTN|nr:hypothetical protein [Nonomuraea solani]SEH03141.1 hypothetical protein SAMN05444920_13345 [Nonomuraea solani]
MRKVRAVLVSAVVVLGVSLTIGATPAQADESAVRLAGVFRDYSECERIGTKGIAQNWWDDYSCVWEPRYGYYFLYA